MAWRGSLSRRLLSTARSASLRRPPAPPLPRLRPPYAPLIRHFSNPRNLGEFAGSTLASRITSSTRAFRGLSNEIEEIMADYVHQEITRNLILVVWRLFLLIVIKDAFLSLFGEQNFKEQKPLVIQQ